MRKQATTGETISSQESDNQESFFGKIKRKLFGWHWSTLGCQFYLKVSFILGYYQEL